MAELANCIDCNNVFAKTVRDICPTCYKEEEKAFEIVYQFIRKRENREATIAEIVEDTGVEEKIIIKFVKQKRLRTSVFPNLEYLCERCDNKITSGQLCEDCRMEMVKEVFDFQEEEAKRTLEEKERINTYYTLNQEKNNR